MRRVDQRDEFLTQQPHGPRPGRPGPRPAPGYAAGRPAPGLARRRGRQVSRVSSISSQVSSSSRSRESNGRAGPRPNADCDRASRERSRVSRPAVGSGRSGSGGNRRASSMGPRRAAEPSQAPSGCVHRRCRIVADTRFVVDSRTWLFGRHRSWATARGTNENNDRDDEQNGDHGDHDVLHERTSSQTGDLRSLPSRLTAVRRQSAAAGVLPDGELGRSRPRR